MSSELGRRRFMTAVGATGLAAGVGGLLPGTANAATFGYTDDGTNYVVNTGSNLVFKVNHSNGDLVSLVYRGTEYQGYGGKNSQVESGLGASTVTVSASSSIIVITVVHGTLKHYYVARSGENNIYLFTNIADASITVLRYIVRLKPGVFPNTTANGIPNTNGDGWDDTTATLIEAQDIWRDTDGTTHAKHYSGLRTMDYDYIGKTTGSVGVWMVRSNHEKASGGPFYRSLLRQSSTQMQDLYEITYYGEADVEAQRFGLQGPYILAFTDGGAPSSALYARNLSTSWIDSLGISGWVGASGRGAVAGVGLSGMDSSYAYTIGFANSAAQYWASATSSGAFDCVNMLPGTYTLTVYKGELAVYSTSVTVTAGATTALHTLTISGDPSTSTAIWRIGDWDGTPTGFKNASLLTHMHPSDTRVSAWTGNFIVGTSAVSDFPCYLWKDVNSGLIVYFKLTAAQAAAALTLRIGTTAAYANGRPQVTVNSWTSSAPAAPSQPDTRCLTVGSYRENNITYTWSVPASAWQTDTSQWNLLTINVISGSGTTDFLSAGISIDCIDLI